MGAISRMNPGVTTRDFASSDGHMVEDVGENAHVEHCIPHGVTDGVLARDDADSVERHASVVHGSAVEPWKTAKLFQSVTLSVGHV